jgi:2-hydroxy-4-carboxymuconate semialdehyde hemiacetal dehydrogenase
MKRLLMTACALTMLMATPAVAEPLTVGVALSRYRFYDKLIVTDRDTYFYDILAGTERTAEGTRPIENEQENAARIIFDFLDAVKNRRPPLASGPSVLPAMRVLQQVQDEWDARYGARSLPGRPLD